MIRAVKEGSAVVPVCAAMEMEMTELELSLPCVLGATKGLNEPRYPKLPDILKAKKKEVKQVAIADLGLEDASGNTRLLELTQVPERSGATMLEGSPREASEKLVSILKEEKVI